MLDRRLAEDEGRNFTEQDNNIYLAWSNSLARTLALLGVTVAGELKNQEPFAAISLSLSATAKRSPI